MTVIRVGVLGAKGKVGRAICEAVEAAPDLELVAQVDAGDPIDTFVEARTEVVVDFTHIAAACDNLEFAAEHARDGAVGVRQGDHGEELIVDRGHSRAGKPG